MTESDRLAADLHFIYCDGIGHPKRGLCHDMADRLIARGWTNLQTPEGQERLARALDEVFVGKGLDVWWWDSKRHTPQVAAEVAEAYREDTDA